MAEERGCGEREMGGIYMVTSLGPAGRPVEDFLICPPQAIPDPEGAGISATGVKALDLGPDGVHVVDWVGSSHYPLVTDFVEETKRLGISRRVPTTFPFQTLGPNSMMILLHARAHIVNWEELVDGIAQAADNYIRPCPLHLTRHNHDTNRLMEMCAGLWWEDGKPDADELESADGRRYYFHQFVNTRYRLAHPPEGVHTHHMLAAFGRFPIHRLEVIADPQQGTHEEALDKIGRCSLPVAVVKE